MGLRQSKYLIRTVLILISFQFFASAFVTEATQEGSIHFSSTIHKQSAHSLTFASLFEKNEKEGEERDKSLTVDVQDLTSSYFDRINAFRATFHFNTVSQHIQEPPLFRLHCRFII